METATQTDNSLRIGILIDEISALNSINSNIITDNFPNLGDRLPAEMYKAMMTQLSVVTETISTKLRELETIIED